MAADEGRDSPVTAPPVVEPAELGRRIRAARGERGLTLKQLEASAGLSATHLSDIERGNASPTLGALTRIARALGRELSYFIDHPRRDEILHLPREACRTFSPRPGVTVEILTVGIPGSRMLSYRICFAGPAGDEVALAAENVTGEAIYTVVRGTVEAEHGDGAVTLSTGDTMQATMLHPHRLRASSAEPAEVILVATHRVDITVPK